MTTLFLILIVVVILTCILLNNISVRIGVPTLLAFIVLGIVFGNVGAIPVYLDNHNFAKDVCSVALLFIMFYGGFGTRWEAVKPVVRESVLLASLGVVVTAGLTGLFCHFALRWGWAESFLLGAVVSSTDAASVFSILRGKKMGLKNNTAPMLEMESGSNDPAAYMLTAIMISVVNGTASGWGLAWMVFAQIVFGAGFGWAIAKGASWALQRMHFSTDGFDTLFIFAVAIAAYAVPYLLGGNGYLSAYIACFAQKGGETIGCGGLCLHDEMPSPDNPSGRCAYLMNIYVREGHRGEGAGKKIVRYLIGCAMERNITKIYLETSPCGRALYEAAGFSEMRDMMLLTYGK